MKQSKNAPSSGGGSNLEASPLLLALGSRLKERTMETSAGGGEGASACLDVETLREVTRGAATSTAMAHLVDCPACRSKLMAFCSGEVDQEQVPPERLAAILEAAAARGRPERPVSPKAERPGSAGWYHRLQQWLEAGPFRFRSVLWMPPTPILTLILVGISIGVMLEWRAPLEPFLKSRTVAVRAELVRASPLDDGQLREPWLKDREPLRIEWTAETEPGFGRPPVIILLSLSVPTVGRGEGNEVVEIPLSEIRLDGPILFLRAEPEIPWFRPGEKVRQLALLISRHGWIKPAPEVVQAAVSHLHPGDLDCTVLPHGWHLCGVPPLIHNEAF